MKLLICILTIFPILLLSQWSADPYSNSQITDLAGEQVIPKIASNGSITYIGWYSSENGNYNVRLQKFDEQGNEQWEQNGLLISVHTSMSWLTDWDMTIDQENYAILTFQDIRNGGNNNIYAYRISPEGAFTWGDDGLELSNSPDFDASPKAAATGSGNIIVSWQADEVIIIQKISPDGNLLWGENGMVLSCDDTYSWPQLLPAGDDDVILKFFEDSGPVWAPVRHVFARRFDADGNPVWDNDVIISAAGGISAWTQVFPFINDGNDGFFIAWHDDRDSNSLASIFIQHISSDGEILFNDDGIEVTTMPARNHFYPDLAYLPSSEEVCIFWSEMDGNQNMRGVYGQKMNLNGDRLWSDNGTAFLELSNQDKQAITVRSAEDDVIVIYEDYSFGNVVDNRVMAMRIDPEGNYVWDSEQVVLSSFPSSKMHQVTGYYQNEQLITAWEDERNDGGDIYAQNVRITGELGPSGVQTENYDLQSSDLRINIYPNPFRSETTISCQFTEERTENTEINIFNLKGQKVKNLQLSKPSNQQIVWNADEFPSGIYFLKLKSGSNSITKKMILMR
ncbi:MAG: T9SS type A sorting domain-containing protein [Candidatus Cloacimonetes bacterium]|nr:T9SS type A sorting domain-containing protein [Candidatus Cloacimonadota bacterium]